jgi:hypothetical protein
MHPVISSEGVGERKAYTDVDWVIDARLRGSAGYCLHVASVRPESKSKQECAYAWFFGPRVTDELKI